MGIRGEWIRAAAVSVTAGPSANPAGTGPDGLKLRARARANFSPTDASRKWKQVGMGGGADGFEGYVHARLPALLRLAYVLTGDPHDAADLVQPALDRTGAR